MIHRASGLALTLLVGCSTDATLPGSNVSDESATSQGDATSSTTSPATTNSATTSGLGGTGYVDEASTGPTAGESSGSISGTGSGTDTGTPDVGSADACGGIDVDGCYAEVLETCGYPATQACVDLIESCYGTIRPPAIVAETLHELCGAELKGFCLDAANPGCGQTYCECIAGVYPFDWDNCFHLTLAGCYDSLLATEPECDAALALCYPSGTQQQWNHCFDQILQQAPDCNCPMCGGADQCEVLLDACMG